VALAWASYDIRAQRACSTPVATVASAALLLPDDGGALPLAPYFWSNCGVGAYPFTP